MRDRWLLIRGKSGDFPAALPSLMAIMRPADVVQVIGFNNGLWRLSHERFNTVLLDLDIADPTAIDYCRQEIARLASVPVINLRDERDLAHLHHASAADTSGHQSPTPRARTMRLPWQRRPRRAATMPPRSITPQ
jgi:hypothetical protein